MPDARRMARGRWRAGAPACHSASVNLLFVTLDQFRADVLGAAGHPLVRTPDARRALRAAASASRATTPRPRPCSPGRAALYTGTYQMNNRVVANGTPLRGSLRQRRPGAAARAATTRRCSATPTSASTRSPPTGPRDPRLDNYDGVLPGLHGRTACSPRTSRRGCAWLAALGYDVPADWVDALRGEPDRPAEHSHSAFLTDRFVEWLDHQRRGVVRAPLVPPPALAVRRGGGVRHALRPRRRGAADRARRRRPPAARGDALAAGRRRARPTRRRCARSARSTTAWSPRSTRSSAGCSTRSVAAGSGTTPSSSSSPTTASSSATTGSSRSSGTSRRATTPRCIVRDPARPAAHGERRRGVHRERRRPADGLRARRRRRSPRRSTGCRSRRSSRATRRRGGATRRTGSGTGATCSSAASVDGLADRPATRAATTSPSCAPRRTPTCSSATARGGASTSRRTPRGAPRPTTRPSCSPLVQALAGLAPGAPRPDLHLDAAHPRAARPLARARRVPRRGEPTQQQVEQLVVARVEVGGEVDAAQLEGDPAVARGPHLLGDRRRGRAAQRAGVDASAAASTSAWKASWAIAVASSVGSKPWTTCRNIEPVPAGWARASGGRRDPPRGRRPRGRASRRSPDRGRRGARSPP